MDLGGAEFKEMHAGVNRIYNVVEKDGDVFFVYVLYYDLKTSKSYDRKTLKLIQTIYRNLKQNAQTLAP